MFFRTGWTEGQDHELATLEASERGRARLAGFREPRAGRPTMSPRLAHVSTNMLGMMYYVERLRRMHPEGLPRRVAEAGGGYGALSFLYAGEEPRAAYAILDLPEMLALQHYFLRLARPERPVRLVTGPEEEPAREGETTLVPASLLGRWPLRADLFVSTFALSEMPLETQRAFEAADWFGARTALVAGQYAEERPEVGWVPHGAVLDAFSAAFPETRVEKFHIGRNYLLEARR
jgi:putative sugar O-methyltransferase